MWERLQKLIDRTESRLSLLGIVSGFLGGSAMTAWFASTADWIDSFGALGRWFAILLGGLFTVMILVACAGFRWLWIHSSMMRVWAEKTEDVNPMDPVFQSKRIKLENIVHPVTRRIKGKRFVGCDILGPALVAIDDEISISNNQIFNCIWIVIQPGPIPASNLIILDDVTIIDGIISNLTFLLSPDAARLIKSQQPQIKFANFTGDLETERPKRTGTESGRRP